MKLLGQRNTVTAGSPADSNSLRYIAGYYDRGSGLYKLGARYYDPTTGRFTQFDPSGQEANPFAYGIGDPLNNQDPSGLLSIPEFLKVLDALLSGGDQSPRV